MTNRDRLLTERVTDFATRERALTVIRTTYQHEKGWVADARSQIPVSDIGRGDVSWFVVSFRGQPAGVLRILYTPPLAEYAKYGINPSVAGFDFDAFIAKHRIAEIGRFAVVASYRRRITIATALMRAAIEDTVKRGFTHLVTDVFERDIHSPYGFHTRVLGFEPVATHETGELNIVSRRITMLLDIKAAYQRLRRRENWMFRQLTGGWAHSLHEAMAT